eukprot:183865-Amorphochlora_amoeboformis.AAC.2
MRQNIETVKGRHSSTGIGKATRWGQQSNRDKQSDANDKEMRMTKRYRQQSNTNSKGIGIGTAKHRDMRINKAIRQTKG